MVKHLILIIISILTLSCTQRSFTIKPVYITSNQLQFGGYYYSVDTVAGSSYYMGKTTNYNGYNVDLHFLFSNGIFNYVGTTFCTDTIEGLSKLLSDSKELDSSFRSNKNSEANKSSWGVYKITNDTVTYEIPVAGQGFPIAKFQMKITDESIVSLESFNKKKNKKSIRIWRFKQYGFKPDSSAFESIKHRF